MRTERDDLDQNRDLPAGTIALDRDARLFATRRGLVQRLGAVRVNRFLRSDELCHPEPPCDLVVRRGNLRVSELLDDGREVTRAVLQAGAVCRVRVDGPGEHGDAPDSPLYSLGHTVLMALGETEIWILPAGALDAE
jgi:hypothetical protein